MCNIAGYVGNRRAAPILLEMLRPQQGFDGFCSTGIATVHEGKLYYRKIVGDVDTLIRETDALDLPGTIGIAHSRSSGDPQNPRHLELAHPYISMAGDMALVSNGTTPNDQYVPQRNGAVQKLDEANFKFRTEADLPKSTWPRLKNGNVVGTGEVRVHLVDYYLKQGLSYTAAIAAAATDVYSDNVFLMLNQNAPDEIFAIRTVRPMEALIADGETYLATCSYGFPKGVAGQQMSLPLLHACSVTRGAITVSGDKIQGEPVDPVTPNAYALARQVIMDTLKAGTEENPVGIEAVFRSLRPYVAELFPQQHSYNERIRLGYEVLCQILDEGNLEKKVVQVANPSGPKPRYAFWFK